VIYYQPKHLGFGASIQTKIIALCAAERKQMNLPVSIKHSYTRVQSAGIRERILIARRIYE